MTSAGGGVVQAGGVAGSDRRGVELGVQRLEGAEPFHRRVGPGVLVGVERTGASGAVGHLDRHDLLLEVPGRDRGGGVQVRAHGPLVDVLPCEARLAGGVLADRDRHVERRCFGRGPVARGHPGLVVTGRRRHGLEGLGHRAEALRATGDDQPVHARPDAPGGDLGGAQARGAVAVVGQAGDVVQAELDGDVASDDTAALEGLGEDDVVDVRRRARPSGRWPRRWRRAPARTRRRRRASPCWPGRSGYGRRRG